MAENNERSLTECMLPRMSECCAARGSGWMGFAMACGPSGSLASRVVMMHNQAGGVRFCDKKGGESACLAFEQRGQRSLLQGFLSNSKGFFHI